MSFMYTYSINYSEMLNRCFYMVFMLQEDFLLNRFVHEAPIVTPIPILSSHLIVMRCFLESLKYCLRKVVY